MHGGLLGKIEKYNSTNRELGELLSAIVKQGKCTDEAIEAMAFRGMTAAKALTDFIPDLIEEGSNNYDTFADSFATIWMESETDRTNFLQSLCPGIITGPAYDGDIDEMKATIVSIIHELEDELDGRGFAVKKSIQADLVTSTYFSSLSEDLEAFCEYMSNSTYSNRQSLEELGVADKAKSLLPELGRRALDVAAIAAGVAAGIVIGSRFKRK